MLKGETFEIYAEGAGNMKEGAGGGTPEIRGDENRLEKKKTFLINAAWAGVCLLLAYLAVRYLLLWLLPFVFAFCVAALLQRPLRWLVAKTGASRGYFSVVLVVLILLALAGLVGALCWQLAGAVIRFVSDEGSMQALQEGIQGITDTVQGWLARLSASLAPGAGASLEGALAGVADKLIGMLPGLFAGVAGWLTGSLPTLGVSFVVWFIASIFLSIDYDRVTGFLLRQVPGRRRPLVDAVRTLCHDTLFKMGKAYLLLMLLTFGELTAGLLLLRVPHAVLLAALIAVVDILPILGTGTVLIPWIAVSLLGGNTAFAVGLTVLYVVITVVRNILEPRVVSRQIGLDPLATLFFMFLGLRATGGIAGMLLFPVGAIIVKQLQEAGHIHLWK